MNILFHGRFQPPHSGHIAFCKYYLERYPLAKLVISCDIRDKDNNNPFSFDFRKQRFERKLHNYLDRVLIVSHSAKQKTIGGCMESLLSIAREYNIYLIVGGAFVHYGIYKFWIDNGFQVEIYPERIYGISSTKIRERLKI